MSDPDKPISDSELHQPSLHLEEGWVRFLRRLGKEKVENHALSARNMLLQEGLDDQRVESYRPVAKHYAGAIPWETAHTKYLQERVFMPTTGEGLPSRLDPQDLDACPETFSVSSEGSPFRSTEDSLHLVRVEILESVARRAGEDPAEVEQLARAVVAKPSGPEAGGLKRVLAVWEKNAQVRPTFAGFWDEVQDLLGKAPSQDPEGWADRLRDRLGLAHIDPAEKKRPVKILVFSYPVKDVPQLVDSPEVACLFAPTVLDGRLSEAFVPAPVGSLTGHVLHLGGNAEDPRREVVHPTVPLQAKHLVRVGEVREPVQLSVLPEARGFHLLSVRQKTGRSDYAASTDSDLLGRN
ncbi:MAG: hypothetical protein SX243_18330 [Acidobacteriota bacterium]|nr:hypothetical protein [Acidobacteriota bacterium]